MMIALKYTAADADGGNNDDGRQEHENTFQNVKIVNHVHVHCPMYIPYNPYFNCCLIGRCQIKGH